MNQNFDSNFKSDEDMERAFDELIDSLRDRIESDESKEMALNEKKVNQLLFTYATLKYLTKDDEDVEVSYKIGEPFKITGSVSVEGTEIEFSSGKWFSRAAKFANNVEIYPLVNGKVRITFTFHSIAVPVK